LFSPERNPSISQYKLISSSNIEKKQFFPDKREIFNSIVRPKREKITQIREIAPTFIVSQIQIRNTKPNNSSRIWDRRTKKLAAKSEGKARVSSSSPPLFLLSRFENWKVNRAGVNFRPKNREEVRKGSSIISKNIRGCVGHLSKKPLCFIIYTSSCHFPST
jgi:hypothetical protein